MTARAHDGNKISQIYAINVNLRSICTIYLNALSRGGFPGVRVVIYWPLIEGA